MNTASNTLPQGQAAAALPKDTHMENAPPPDYTPRRPVDLVSLARAHVQRQQYAQSINTTTLNGTDDDGDIFDGISLRINTAINVTQNNNLICLTNSPAEHANAIAAAVVEAMYRNSSGQCGIPMIDEDGHPRPIRIEVDAGMAVDGSGNIIGNHDIVSRVLTERGMTMRQRGTAAAPATTARNPVAESSQMGENARRSSQ